jgi:hypothetical protein
MKKMNKKNLLYVTLFCLFLGINFLPLWKSLINEFQEAITPSSLTIFQIWFYDIFGLLFNAFVVACIVGVFAYYYRGFKSIYYIIFGIFLSYFDSIILSLPYLIRGKSLISDAYFFYSPDLLRICILLLIQLFFIIVASYSGYKKAKEFDYFNEDEKSFYLYGIPKKIWVLLVFAFNPVVQTLIKYTIVRLYDFTTAISSTEFWKHVFSFSNIFSGDYNSGLIGMLYLFFSIVFMWGVSGGLFYFGLETIKNKDSKFRLLKIIVIFILVPLLIIGIPLLRNRTWFF